MPCLFLKIDTFLNVRTRSSFFINYGHIRRNTASSCGKKTPPPLSEKGSLPVFPISQMETFVWKWSCFWGCGPPGVRSTDQMEVKHKANLHSNRKEPRSRGRSTFSADCTPLRYHTRPHTRSLINIPRTRFFVLLDTFLPLLYKTSCKR